MPVWLHTTQKLATRCTLQKMENVKSLGDEGQEKKRLEEDEWSQTDTVMPEHERGELNTHGTQHSHLQRDLYWLLNIPHP